MKRREFEVWLSKPLECESKGDELNQFFSLSYSVKGKVLHSDILGYRPDPRSYMKDTKYRCKGLVEDGVLRSFEVEGTRFVYIR